MGQSLGNFVDSNSEEDPQQRTNEENDYRRLRGKMMNPNYQYTQAELTCWKNLEKKHHQRMLNDTTENNHPYTDLDGDEYMTGGAGGAGGEGPSILMILAVIIIAILVLFVLYYVVCDKVVLQFLVTTVVALTSIYVIEMLTR